VVMQNKLMNIIDGYMDWLLFVTMMGIAESVTVREMLALLQTMREIADCHRHCGRLLSVFLIIRFADCVTDNVGDCWLLQTMREIADWVRQWWWLLTEQQTMFEIVNCVTDSEGDCWLC
jgi:hypothetical protein